MASKHAGRTADNRRRLPVPLHSAPHKATSRAEPLQGAHAHLRREHLSGTSVSCFLTHTHSGSLGGRKRERLWMNPGSWAQQGLSESATLWSSAAAWAQQQEMKQGFILKEHRGGAIKHRGQLQQTREITCTQLVRGVTEQESPTGQSSHTWLHRYVLAHLTGTESTS